MLEMCNGAACRLRARDCALGPVDGVTVPCLGRCDRPVAAARDGRALTLVARSRVEPWTPPPLPRQPTAPVLLRDAAFADQRDEAAARRRGAYAALEKITDDAARALVDAVARTPSSAMAEHVLRDRDPHLVREGEAIAARAGVTVDAVTAARLVRAAQFGVEWLERHATIVVAVAGDVLNPGVYELHAGASIAEALAAAGGVVDGVRLSQPSAVLADDVATKELTVLAPASLVALHARRDPVD